MVYNTYLVRGEFYGISSTHKAVVYEMLGGEGLVIFINTFRENVRYERRRRLVMNRADVLIYPIPDDIFPENEALSIFGGQNSFNTIPHILHRRPVKHIIRVQPCYSDIICIKPFEFFDL